MAENLKVLQLNCAHARTAVDNLRHRMSRERSFVALIQEPWIRGTTVMGFGRAGQLFHTPGVEPRACIVAANNLSVWFLPNLSDRDCASAQVQMEDGSLIVIASVYMTHEDGLDLPSPTLRRLTTHCEDENLPLLIGCDANAHHQAWGSTDTNRRGEILLDYVIAKDLVVENEGNSPTFVTSTRKEVLDITLSNLSMSRHTADWKVEDKDSFSDHRIISMKLLATPQKETKLFRPVRKINRSSFLTLLSGGVQRMSTEEPTTPSSLEERAGKLTRTVQRAFKAATPLVSVKINGRSPGWSDELTQMKREVRRLYKLLYRNEDPQRRAEYLRARRRYQSELRKVKRGAWREFCEQTESLPDTARLQRMLSKTNMSCQSMLRRQDGSYTTVPNEVLSCLFDTHFPGHQDQDRVFQGDHGRKPLPDDLLTRTRVEAAIASFDPYKAAGPDLVSPSHLQLGKDLLCPLLEVLFKACLRLGYVPKVWQEARVVFAPKPGKVTYDIPKAYRPICLTSFMLKTLERCIDWYIRLQVFPLRQLNEHQYAYRTGLSTTTALHQLTSRIEKSFEKKEFALGIFVDVEGAFSCAPVETMMRGLSKFPIHETVRRWIEFALNSRTIIGELRGCRLTRRVTRGTPQGGVMSPIIWDMTIDDLISELEERVPEVHRQVYSDDVSLLPCGPKPLYVYRKGQAALDVVDGWCQRYGLSVNPNKVEMVMFTLNRNWPNRSLRLGGHRVQLQNQVKYLGVVFDRQLTWNQHVDEKVRKCVMLFAQCRRIVGKTWGLKPKCMAWLYTAVIRPILAYGVTIWVPALRKESIKKKLNKVQRLACLAITGAMCTTPTVAMECIVGLPPIDLFLQEEALKGMLQIKTSGRWRPWGVRTRELSRTSHVQWCEREWANCPFLSVPSDLMNMELAFDRSFSVSFPSREQWRRASPQLIPKRTGRINCYTDGSLTSRGAGAGAVTRSVNEEDKFRIPLGKTTTVFQAEMLAILEVVNHLRRKETVGKTIRIYSDSQAALKALSNFRVTSKLTRDCLPALNTLGQSNRVRLTWVPGHQGFQGNELADELAKEASARPVEGPGPPVPLARGALLTALKVRSRYKHRQRWHTLTGSCRQSKEAIKAPFEPGQAKRMQRLERGDLRLVVGLLTGHCRLNRHLSLLKVVDHPRCPRCGAAEETVIHFGGACPAYWMKRIMHLGKPHLTLDEMWEKPVSKILAFAKDTGRFDEPIEPEGQ